MSNPQKKKGSKYEREVCDFLNAAGVVAERIPAGATLDRGDLWVPNWTVEIKNQQRINLAEWMDETVAEQQNRSTPWHALWVHRRGKGSAADSYVVMTGQQATSLMRALP